MKWRLFMGFILCGACVACVTKAPPKFIVPPAPAQVHSTAFTTPPVQSNQEVGVPNSLSKGTGTETASAERGGVVTPKRNQPERRLIGCVGSSCTGESGMGQGSGRYLKYKRTSYIGYLPIRTAFFVVLCANEAQGEELYYFDEKWCLASEAGLESVCYEKESAMKIACAQVENIELK